MSKKENHKEITVEQFALRAGCSLEEVMKSLRTARLSGRVISFVPWGPVRKAIEDLGGDADALRKTIDAGGTSPIRHHLIREESLEPFMRIRKVKK